jgi:N utilization substance protein A
MANELKVRIEQVSREKNLDPDVVVRAIEDAILQAAKRYFNNDEDLRSRFNHETGDIDVFAVKEVVETVTDEEIEISLEEARQLIPEAELRMEIEFPKQTEGLGRIAAQAAKQVIFQKVRDAERDNVIAEFERRRGDVLNGVIKRQEGTDYIIDLGRTEAVLPRKEQSRAENYQTGDRIRVAILSVQRSTRGGPQVTVSRTDGALLRKLLEMEVPEIFDGTVKIRACVREPGERAKVAVESTHKDIDPIGACVGMKGTRVQAVIRELRGEKIDIIEWDDDPVALVKAALQPAQVSRVQVVDTEQKIMEVVVEDKQLSLAIGKRGQNVRLAAKLVGWRIEIKSEEEKRLEVAAQLSEFRSMEGVDKDIVQRLMDARVQGLDHLLQMTDEEFASIDIDEAIATSLRQAAAAALPKVVTQASAATTPEAGAETDAEAAPDAAPDADQPKAGETA